MENKLNFNKELFTTIALQNFLTDYARSGSVQNSYNKLLNLNRNNDEKRKILENCRALFENASTKKEVDLEIATIRTEINTTKGRNPIVSEIAKWLINCFSEEIFAVNKRTYDMSQIASSGTLRTFRTPQGITLKDVGYATFEQMQQLKYKKDGIKIKRPEAFLEDIQGNPIHIKLIGCLVYGLPTHKRSLRKYSITKTINEIEQKYEKFLDVDINALNHDINLRRIVASELLSPNNLERSNADDYIGEIFSESLLKPGSEKFQDSFYTYQITQKHALVYDGERIEAIRAYKQQESMKKATSQANTDIKQNSDTEAER